MGPILVHWNIQGYLNNLNELQLLLEEVKNVAVISLNEHWIERGDTQILNKLKNFVLADSFSREDQCRGGSCLLIKENIKFKVRNDLKFLNEENNFEGSFIESLETKSIFISVYRIPGCLNDKIFLNKFDCLLQKLTREGGNKTVFIASDHNIDLLKNK